MPKRTSKKEKSDKDLLLAASRAILTAKPKPKDRSNRQRLSSSGLWSKPFHSEALGVSPDQVAAASEEMRRHGVPLDFDEQGRAIITSEKQFRLAAKACGMWDGARGFCGGRDEDGRRLETGRGIEERKQEFKRALERGDYD